MIIEKKTEFRNGNNQIDEVINASKVIFLSISFWLFQWEGREKAEYQTYWLTCNNKVIFIHSPRNQIQMKKTIDK